MTVKTEWEMVQPAELPRRMSGCRSNQWVDCGVLAREAWGEAAEDPNSGLVAFGYLWRRFGPPIFGADPHKDLVSYVLTTPDPEVFLDVTLSGSKLNYAPRLLVANAVEVEWNRPFVEWHQKFEAWFRERYAKLIATDIEAARNKFWDTEPRVEAVAVIGDIPHRKGDREDWRSGFETTQRVCCALLEAMQELLRPVLIRDVPINILGRVRDQDCALRREASRSKYAGYGVPLKAMDELIASD